MRKKPVTINYYIYLYRKTRLVHKATVVQSSQKHSRDLLTLEHTQETWVYYITTYSITKRGRVGCTWTGGRPPSSPLW